MKKILGIVVLGLFWSNPALAFNYLSDFGATGGSAIVGLIMIIILFFMVKDGEGTGFDEKKWREYNEMLKKDKKKMLKTHNLDPKTGFYTKKKKKKKKKKIKK